MSQSRSNSDICERRSGCLTDVVNVAAIVTVLDIMPAIPSESYRTMHELAGAPNLTGGDYFVELAVLVASAVYMFGRPYLRRNA